LSPRASSAPAAIVQSAPTIPVACGESASCGAIKSSVYEPAGIAVTTIAKMFATMSTHAPYAPNAAPKAVRIHEYDEPALGKRAPKREYPMATQAMTRVTKTSVSGAA